MYQMHYYNGWGNSAFPLISVFLNILFWILVVVLIVKLIKHLSYGGVHCEHCEHSDVETNSDSIEIVKARYAKGEITKKEFDQLKKDLAE